MTTRYVFSRPDLENGQELWITDGTSAGTVLVKDINPGTSSSSPSGFTSLGNGKSIFTATDGTNGQELWITDGTSAGTVLVKDIWAGSSGSVPFGFTSLGNGQAVFSAFDATNGYELWITDGTSAGTVLVKDINAGVGSIPQDFTSLGNGKAVFSANNGTNGRELWITDGTSAGTVLVKDINAGTSSSSPSGFTSLGNGKAVFSATDGTNGRELWITDGTSAGTVLVKNISVGSNDSLPQGFTSLGNGKAVFRATDATNGPELWITDGTPGGTVLVQDIWAGSTSSSPQGFTSLGNGKAVFSAADATNGPELWITDGMSAGTVLVKDIWAGSSGSVPFGFTSLGNGKAVFSAADATNGQELWITNGTSAGTVVVKDILAVSSSSTPQNFTSLGNGQVMFQAIDSTSGWADWITDGTSAGTVLLKDIAGSAYSTSGALLLNQAPTITGLPGTAQSVTVGTAAALDDFMVADPDGAGVSLSVTLTTTNGTLNNLTDADTNTAGIQLTGTAATINAAISGATFTATASGAASIGISVSDGVVASPTTGTYNLTASGATPTDISITASSVNQSAGTNAAVGTLSTTDADTASGHTYSLVSGTGATHNALFNISGSTLRANDAGALAAGDYTVRIRTTDPNSLQYEEAFTVTVVDDVAPTLAINTVAGDDTINGTEDDSSVEISGTSNGADGRTVTVDVGGTLKTATIASGGAWTVSLSSAEVQALAEGNVSVTANVSDGAGNAATPATKTLVYDKTAPVFAPSTSTPVDDATVFGIGNDIVLRFGERLDASSDLTKVNLKDVTTDTLVPATFTLNADGNIVINPTGNLDYSTSYYVTWDANALKDAAGNAVTAVTDETTYNFTTEVAADPPPPPPPPPPVVVDGASVTTTTTTTTTPGGQTVNQTTQTVAPVGTPPAGGDGLADVPLVSDASGNPLLAVSLPSGVGVQVTSISGTGLSLDSQVSTAVQGFTSGGDPGLATAVTEGLQDAFGSAPPANLVVRSMAVTVQGNTAPTQPIQISGSTNGNEALIIDVSSLPSGTVLDLSNVRFAVIVGNTNIVGGEGRNVVVADGGQQFMVLGADDDELHAGAGDDTVGSKGGNDKLWGDEGNDKVVGGIGNDELHGGDGNDLLQGGASDAGRWSVQLDSQGQMRLFFTPGNAQLADSTGLSLVGNWTSAQGQGPITDARLSFIHQDYGLLQDVALLIHGLSGRLPSLSELSLFGALGLGSGALAEIAHGYHVQTSGVQPQAIEAQLQAVISRVLGAAGSDAARQSLFNQSKAVLDNGGNWADVWLTVVRSDFHKASMLGSESGTINLVRNSALAETGWSLNSGDNQLFGDAGNDVLVGGAGNNVLDGGSGTDLAVLFGSWSDFQVARQGADLLLKNVVSGSVNTLRDVEFIQVGTQALSTSAMANLSANGAYTDLKPLADQLIATVGLANTAAVTWHPEWV